MSPAGPASPAGPVPDPATPGPDPVATPVLTPLTGKVVLVTGAGNGLGRAIAVQSARAGARVVIAAPRDNAEDTLAMVRSAGGEGVVARMDVTVAAEVEAAVELARSAFGGLDAMVHNATSRRSSEVSTLDEVGGASWDDHLAVSVRGAYLTARAAYPELLRRKGRFVVFTSPAAFEGAKMLPAYGAVKGALRGMMKALAVEWGPKGIGVVAVSPLAVTPSLFNAYREDPTLEARMSAATPMGRAGDAQADVAPAVVFLLSDAARYLTGQTVAVDGARFTGL